MRKDSKVTLHPRAASAGCSYFGVRIVRHVRRDMAGLAARGYSGVLHTFSENDFAYYRGTMGEIVEASHAVGLAVQGCPWGLGRTFGGEAESRFVTFHPDECQVLDDGRRVAGACLNSPAYRAFCKEWAEAVLEDGVDAVFWDEPAWMVPWHVGVDDPTRWSCICDRCAERFGGPVPADLTPEVKSFRESSVVDFLREMLAHVAERGGKNTVCLLPSTEGLQGISDWNMVASLPGLHTFATDPYWKHWNEPAGPFVRRFPKLLRETCERHGVASPLWLPSFGLTAGEIPQLEAAIDATAERLARGGRLVYVGAGTSGSLAALDAAECGPTFGSRPGEVVAVVAGDSEAAEDDREAGVAGLHALGLGAGDVVVGVSASGSTPFTLAALEAAAQTGALCIAVVSVHGSSLGALA